MSTSRETPCIHFCGHSVHAGWAAYSGYITHPRDKCWQQCALPGDSPWCSAPSWSKGGINTLEAVSWLVSFPGWGSDRRNGPRDHLQQTAGTYDRTQTRRRAGELSAFRYCSAIFITSLAYDVSYKLCDAILLHTGGITASRPSAMCSYDDTVC